MSDADTLAVAGEVTFAGGSTTGMLTAGRMILAGGITAQSVAATFAPSGTHRVVMAGAADRAITDVIGVSFFNDLALQTTGTVTVARVAGQVQVNGLLISDAIIKPTVTGGNILAWGVDAQRMDLDNAVLSIGNGPINALDGITFLNFPAGTQQLIVNRNGGTYTFNNLQFSQDNGAFDVYIEARDADVGDGDQLTINLAAASPADGTPGTTSEYDAVVNWVAATAGPPAQVSFTVQPTDVAAGSAITPAVQVAIQDANTITVDTSTASVTVAINDNPGGGTLSGTTTVAAVNGIATFSDLSIDMAGVGYSLIAFSTGLTAEVSAPFAVTAGAATTIGLESGNNQTAAPNATIPDPVAVKVTDTFGNGVAGVEITWAVTAGGGSITSPSTTDESGIATATWTLGANLGTNTVQATPSTLTLTGSPVEFSATGSNAIAWINASGGNWSNGANWQGGSPPGPTEGALIDLDGTYVITLDTDVNVESIALGGNSGRQTLDNNGYAITASGTVRVIGTGALQVASTSLTAGTVINEGTITLNGSNVTGPIDNRSELVVVGYTEIYDSVTTTTNSLLELDGAGADASLSLGLTNNGTIYFNSAESGGYPSLYVNSGSLINAVGGKIRFTGPGGGYLLANLDNRDSLKVESAESVNLDGTTIINSGVMYAATAELDVDAAFTNSGIVSVAAGQVFGSYGTGFNNEITGNIQLGLDATLDIASTTFASAVGFTIDSSLTVYIDGSALTSPSVTIAGNLTVAAGGTLEVLSNTVTVDTLINYGESWLDGAVLNASIHNGGTISATNTGNAINGTIATDSASIFDVEGTGSTLSLSTPFDNDGSILMSSSEAGTAPSITVGSGTLMNTYTGSIESVGPAGGLIIVDSLVNWYSVHPLGGGTLTIQGPYISNNGAFTAHQGNLTVSGDGTFINAGNLALSQGFTFTRAGGTFESTYEIRGGGTIDVSGTIFANSSRINPGGGTGGPVATLTFDGEVTLTGGEVNIEIDGITAGTEYDVLRINGPVALGGTLAVHASITPTRADTFTVMTFASHTGEFTDFTGLSIDDSLALIPILSATELNLIVAPVTDSAAVSPTGATLTTAGATQQFTAEAYGGGTLLPGKVFTWASLDPHVATIDGTGLVTAVANGQVIVQAEVDGVTSTAVVTVAITPADPVNLWANPTDPIPTANYKGVWGSASDNVWAVGAGETYPNSAIIHFDGSAWNVVAGPTTGGQLNAIWGSGSDDIWAGGDVGSLLHFDGTDWIDHAGSVSAAQQGIWGSAPNDVWMVSAAGGAAHFDGTSWTTTTISPDHPLDAIWGSARDDIWAVGRNGTAIHYDGSSWSMVATPSTDWLQSVWGTGPNDVWAVGLAEILHYDGTAWTATTTPSNGQPSSVRGLSASDAWISTGDGELLHYDGTDWSDILDQGGTLNSLWVTPSDAIWGVGGGIARGYRNATVSVNAPADTITAIDGQLQLTADPRDGGTPIGGVTFTWTSDVESVATVDGNGLVTAHANGLANIWATAPGGATGVKPIYVQQQAATVNVSPSGASIAGGTQVFTVTAEDANGYSIASPTATWTSLNTGVATVSASGIASAVRDGQSTIVADVDGALGHAVLTVWTSGAATVNVWGTMTHPGTASQLIGLWGAADNDLFIGGDDGELLQYDGSAWSLQTPPNGTQVWDFWGTSGTDVYAAGFGGVFHFDGTDWTAMPGIGGYNRSVWGSDSDDVYFVGGNASTPSLIHWDGTGFTSMTNPAPDVLGAVWGAAPDDVFIVGAGCTVLRGSMDAWTEMTVDPACSEDLWGVWGFSADQVYAVGTGGRIMEWDGANWTAMTNSNLSLLRDIWGSSPNDLYAAGIGTMLHYDGATWEQYEMPPHGTIGGVWGTFGGDVIAAAAGGGIILRGVRAGYVTVTPDTTTITALNATTQLSAEAFDTNNVAVEGVVFTWSSDNESVATVDPSTGEVTAVANGTANITATSTGGANAAAMVTVSQQAATVYTSPSAAPLSGVSATQAFSAQAWDAGGNPIPSPSITWASKNAAIATVDAGGTATLVRDGQVPIQAQVDNAYGYGLLSNSVPNVGAARNWDWGDFNSNYIFGMWGYSASDIWAVGERGTILHYNGSVWSEMTPTVSTTYLRDVWGSGPSDVWAVGTYIVFRYNGFEWTQFDNLGTIKYGVWGAAAADVWAVGSGGSIHNFNGTAWSSVTSPTTMSLNDVWGSASNNVWAVGRSGTIIYYNGSIWSDVTPGLTTNDLQAVWGSSGSDVWAVGVSGTVLHYDGSSWSEVVSAPSSSYYSVWGTSPTNVWLGNNGSDLFHWDGSAWTPYTSATSGVVYDMWGATASDVWLGTSNGAITHYDGSSWSDATPRLTYHDINDVWASNSNDIWAVGTQTVLHYDGGSWSNATPGGFTSYFYGAGGTGPDDIWAVGYRGLVYHYDGGSWTDQSPVVTSSTLRNVWAGAPNDAWAVGDDGTVIHYDGTNWVDESPGVGDPYLRGVWGSAPDDIWVIGNNGTLLHYNGTAWTDSSRSFTSGGNALQTDGSLSAIWGSGPNDIWIVGGGNLISGALVEIVYHFDGTSWSDATPGILNATLYKVWGTGPSDMWALGNSGTIIHWDGTSLNNHTYTLVNRDLNGIYGDHSGDLWVLGENGTILTGTIGVP